MAVCGRCWICAAKFDCAEKISCGDCTEHKPLVVVQVVVSGKTVWGYDRQTPELVAQLAATDGALGRGMICGRCEDDINSGAVGSLVDALRSARNQ